MSKIKKHTKETLLEQLKQFTKLNKRIPNTHEMKLKLIREGLLEEKCSIVLCPIKNIWLENPISLHLDHIDGNPTNNLLSNLRLVCPNCHSQTSTYCGKNISKVKTNYNCIDCNNKVSSWVTRCLPCFNKNKIQKTKIEWPNEVEIIELIKHNSITKAANSLGVSGNALRKFCKKKGIDYQLLRVVR